MGRTDSKHGQSHSKKLGRGDSKQGSSDSKKWQGLTQKTVDPTQKKILTVRTDSKHGRPDSKNGKD